MKTLSTRSQVILRKLVKLIESEHICGCDSDTCDVNVSFEHGYTAWSVYLFDSSGAASDEFSNLYSKLPKSFYKYARTEADALCEQVEHDKCPTCNAVVWHDGNHGEDIQCDSCNNSFQRSENNGNS